MRRLIPLLVCLTLLGCEPAQAGGEDSGADLGPGGAPCQPVAEGGACQVHCQCPSQVCAPSRAGPQEDRLRYCIEAAQVHYVRAPAPGKAACSDGYPGTLGAPLCTLGEAIQRNRGQLIRLLPGRYEERLLLQSGQYEIYGPDQRAAEGASCGDGDQDGLAVLSPKPGESAVALSGHADLSMEGIVLRGGLGCEGAARVRLAHGAILGSAGIGLHGKGCMVELAHDALRCNQGGAIHLEGGRYDIQQSSITANAGKGVAAVRIYQSRDEPRVFRGNVILDNQAGDGVAGGIDCGEGRPVELQDLLLCGNSEGREDGEMRQWVGQCVFLTRPRCG